MILYVDFGSFTISRVWIFHGNFMNKTTLFYSEYQWLGRFLLSPYVISESKQLINVLILKTMTNKSLVWKTQISVLIKLFQINLLQKSCYVQLIYTRVWTFCSWKFNYFLNYVLHASRKAKINKSRYRVSLTRNDFTEFKVTYYEKH